MQFNERNLGYFGSTYELKVINQIIGAKIEKSKGQYRRETSYGKRIVPIITPHHFTHKIAKRIIVFLKNYYNKTNSIPYYDTISEYIKSKIQDDLEQEMVLTYLKDIENTDVEDTLWVQENTINFINTKNLYAVWKDIELNYINKGKYNEYEKISELVSDALVSLKDDDRLEAFVEGDTSDLENIRGMIIPTGVKSLDRDMNGGLGLGELAIVVAGLKVGKAQPNTCKIYTPDGYKLMGELQVGDKILGSDNKPQLVLGVFPQGIIDTYKISFTDNTSTYCSKEHLWSVKKFNSNEKYKVKTLEELLDDYEQTQYEIPIISGLNSDTNNIPKIIHKITYSGQDDCTCIKVSNKDSLYVTDDFILTHNTTFATYVANNAAKSGFNVLQIFFEDTEEQVKMKHRSKFTSMPLSSISNKKNKKAIGSKTDTQLKKVKEAGGCLVVHKMDSTESTVEDIRKLILKARERGVWFQDTKEFKKITFDLVLIDYVDCIKSKGNFKEDWGGDKEVMRDLEKLSSRKHGLGFACWAFTQGGRSSLNSSLVAEGDVGGTTKKLQIAHFIASISKTIEQRPEGKATFAILGSRIGRDGIIYKDCTFDNGNMKIDFNEVDTLADYVNNNSFNEQQQF